MISALGCAGLLVKRSTDQDLRLYTAPTDYFNLSFILATVLSGFCAWLFFDRTFAASREFMKGLLTFGDVNNMNAATYASTLLICLALIYLPFTRMWHYLAKYFTYHRVRWDDEPNTGTGRAARSVDEALQRPIGWAAPHIQSGKNWSEVTTRIEDVIEKRAK